MKEAALYDRHPDGRVHCRLCPHDCVIDDGRRGACRVRENRQGTLYTLAHGVTTVQNVDPIEKKPLFHFRPGTRAYSIATHGCNLRCGYCINWMVSQPAPAEIGLEAPADPEGIVRSARASGCETIAYTYVEPTIFFEFADEIAQLARAAGLANVWKTNGFISQAALALCLPSVDAANVDLKTFRDGTYQRLGGRLKPVLDALATMKARGVWVEVTTVVIPGMNDGTEELEDIARFIVSALGPETPWHVARFFPAYHMADVPPTPVRTLLAAREIGWSAGMRHIYFGNLPLEGSQDTRCAGCGQVLIRRHRGTLTGNTVHGGACPGCARPLAGVGLG